MMIQQAIQLPGIVKVGVDSVLVRVRFHKNGIIRRWTFVNGNVCTGISKRQHLFLGNTDQFHVMAVHPPQIV